MNTNALYAQRRALLAQKMGAGGVAIIPTAPEQQRNRDSDFPYRADSYFYYLTGFTEPQAWLVVTGDGTSTLFCQPKDMEREIWDGYRLGPTSAPEQLGLEAAYSVAELDAQLPGLIDGREAIWYPFATHKGLETRIDSWLGGLRARVRYGALCPKTQHDLCGVLDEMRLVKDRFEQATMLRAGQISAGAHIRAMQLSANMLRAGQEVREYHLEAELLHEFRRHGAQSPAYGSIVAAGANACVLHYRADRGLVRSGELVLIDAACELDGYASDITRTFPANGVFSGPQRALYELVLASQEAAIAATKAGARFTDPHDAAVKVLAQGMLDVGLLDHNKVGSLDDVIEKRAYFQFYMHRTGHWIGMDVHDCGDYTEPSEIGQVSTRQDALTGATIKDRPARILRAGMALTIEPGIYVRPADGVPEQFHNIGIRIEDDAIITNDGCTLLTREVPVGAAEIEALMRG
ncbi:aminopeptidase P N-terminal domain-containing protein [Rhodoferax sp.]|uniref:aminopeptidase P N-terminal domain-containing protein n=1 Tax=Rhodoferax sp. TaxID=50421 RepID=UPI00271C0FA0|nr:aminopeptidase P N-terminal domain-containing protein [Rhodoferax sp.]MDO9144922.1 aminopeptidase P N-terminal domain-containing protein [Rhodoferax sp.]MDP2443766.1 aminopeptidase P N-terminal domain-containing protein [Rhodoferax sp.]MDP3864187.1 aminopeptidase P N-terminal domain-containing protein [Rhodoferax sp.]MDZ4207788.1 aminopeptidase P N-terminal domain-containing protein [Rhodoferax sp.]